MSVGAGKNDEGQPSRVVFFVGKWYKKKETGYKALDEGGVGALFRARTTSHIHTDAAHHQAALTALVFLAAGFGLAAAGRLAGAA